MSIFGKKDVSASPAHKRLKDSLLDDLPRGVHGRRHKDSSLEKGYFENEEFLAQVGFEDQAGDNFLGVVGGMTLWFQMREW